jgi:hypothetical protein
MIELLKLIIKQRDSRAKKARVKYRWRAQVNTAISLRFPQNTENFSYNWATTNFHSSNITVNEYIFNS